MFSFEVPRREYASIPSEGTQGKEHLPLSPRRRSRQRKMFFSSLRCCLLCPHQDSNPRLRGDRLLDLLLAAGSEVKMKERNNSGWRAPHQDSNLGPSPMKLRFIGRFARRKRIEKFFFLLAADRKRELFYRPSCFGCPHQDSNLGPSPCRQERVKNKNMILIVAGRVPPPGFEPGTFSLRGSSSTN